MKRKIITNDDLINALPKESQDRVNREVEKIVKKWGGVRENAGRKPVVQGTILKFTKRVTADEARFIDYARTHNLNYNDLMQG